MNQFIILFEFHVVHLYSFYQKYDELLYLKTKKSAKENVKLIARLTDSVDTIPLAIAWGVAEMLSVINCNWESTKYLYSCYIFNKYIINLDSLGHYEN